MVTPGEPSRSPVIALLVKAVPVATRASSPRVRDMSRAGSGAQTVGAPAQAATIEANDGAAHVAPRRLVGGRRPGPSV